MQALFATADASILDELQSIAKIFNLTPDALHSKWESYSINYNKDFDAKSLADFKKTLLNVIKQPSATPQRPLKSKKLSLGGSASINFKPSPASLVQVASQNPGLSLPSLASQENSFQQRQHKGRVEVVYNGSLQTSLYKSDKPKCEIAQLEGYLTSRQRYMNEKPQDVAEAIDSKINEVGSQIAQHYGFLEDIANPGEACQVAVRTFGRVISENNQKLDEVFLESSRQIGGGKVVRLNMPTIENFSLFPGQVIGVEGTNLSGHDLFTLQSLFNAPFPEMPSTKVSQLNEYSYGGKWLNGSSLSLMTAAGPYQISGSWQADGFVDLMQVASEKNPDVLVLFGPFVDDRNPDLQAGRAPCSELQLFQQNFGLKLVEYLEQSSHSQVVLVPSVYDAFHPFLSYPQVPFDKQSLFSTLTESKMLMQRIHCVANPSVFAVNEVHFAVTSVDTVYDLVAEEYHKGDQSDRMSRMVGHMLSQQSFYPIDPPASEDLYINRLQGLQLQVKPDIMLLPSKLAPYAKSVQGTVIVNPGVLCKNASGGTYALVDINPMHEEDLVVADKNSDNYENEYMYHGVEDRTKVQVIRI